MRQAGSLLLTIIAGLALAVGVPVESAYAQQGAEAAQFFAGNQDIPVMPGLVELEGRSFSFDKPEGDITEIVAAMEGVSRGEVVYFYQMTLPQFGWGKVSEGAFYRKDEYLELSFDEASDEAGRSLVKIMIRPSR